MKIENDRIKYKIACKVRKDIMSAIAKRLTKVDIQDAMEVGGIAFSQSIVEFVSKIFKPEYRDMQLELIDEITMQAKEFLSVACYCENPEPETEPTH